MVNGIWEIYTITVAGGHVSKSGNQKPFSSRKSGALMLEDFKNAKFIDVRWIIEGEAIKHQP